MKDSFLVQNLRQLGPKQWQSFLQFLHSPYFNQRTDVIELATYLHQSSRQWSKAELDRHVLFNRFFAGEKFDLQKLKNLFSILQKRLRLFLSVETFLDTPFLNKAILSQSALTNGMTRLWEQQKKQLLAEYSPEIDHYFLLPNILEQEKNYILRQGDRTEAHATLRKQMTHLDLAYWRMRLRLSVESMSLTKVLQQQFSGETDLLPIIPKTLSKHPVINTYQQIYWMLSKRYPDSFTHFEALLSIVKTNDFPQCSPDEIYTFYIYALNYCTGRINSGDETFYARLFAIYEIQDQHQRLLRNGHLSQWTYLNIIATACHLKKFEWAEVFINKYYEYILPHQQHNALYYNLSLLAFHKGNFNEALDYLPKVSSSDPYYALNGRMLELRVFFELEEWFLLDALLERLRIYLLRDKQLPKSRKKESQNFLKLIKLLALHCQAQKSKTEQAENLQKIEQKITTTDLLMHRAWLLDKCSESKG